MGAEGWTVNSSPLILLGNNRLLFDRRLKGQDYED